MKLRASFASALFALIASTLVAGCGGGNDQDAGGQTAFNIVPTEITVSGPNATTCPFGGFLARVHVFGGAGPYKVYNSLPGYLSLSKTTLDRPGDYVDVFQTVDNACMTNIPIIITDALGRQATFAVNATKGTD